MVTEFGKLSSVKSPGFSITGFIDRQLGLCKIK